MRSSSTRLPTPEGPGSVSGAPNLPAGFTSTFKSVYVNIAGHWLMEQAPDHMLAALTAFLAPYKAAHNAAVH